MSTKAFTINRANHTGFTVSSLEESLKFWHGLLDLPIVFRGEYKFDNAAEKIIGIDNVSLEAAMVLLPGNHIVELIEYKSPEHRTAMRPRPCDVGNVHLAIEVSNMKALMAEAKKLGWTAGSDEPVIMKLEDGTTRGLCFIRDMDGVSVECIETLEE
jgi:catechol 2,3-dioxygenase-like lactoylglutathione lyase family enzyme